MSIPADIERQDRILANLTARQLAILVSAAVVVWLGFVATGPVVPLPVFAVLAMVALSAAAALALGERDGVGLDRLLVYALVQRSQPRRLVIAPEGAPALPAWARSRTRHEREPASAPLRLPVRAVGSDGTVDLGGDGVAVLVRCSTVSFALRTPGEQAALVGAFAAWLNSLSGPTQILVHAQPINVHPAIDALRERAAGLPHPALEDAALDHADFLAELAATRDLLARQVLVVLREPHGPTESGSTGASAGVPRGAGADGRGAAGAATRVLRRAEQAARSLAPAGITARVLAADEVAAVLAHAADPTAPPMEPGMAAPGQIITASAPPGSPPGGGRGAQTATKEARR